MKMLVTGGAGFIGSHFIRYVLEKYPNRKVVCVDSLTYAGNLDNLKEAVKHPAFEFVKLDIRDREGIFKLFEALRPEVVVNFAAESHVDRSIDNPALFLDTNVMGTQVLLDASRKAGVKRFHQISTDEVYGDLPLDRKDLLFTEQTPLGGSSPYSASKGAADLLVLATHRTYGLPVTISRCSNNYGEGQFPEKLIPLTIACCLENRRVPVYGTGCNVRDWLYVKDHCVAIDLVLEKGLVGEVYHIGGNNEMTNLQVVKTILHAMGRSEALIEFVPDRPGHDLRYALDSTKIQKELGWTPETDFQEGLRKTLFQLGPSGAARWFS